jgi:hypothetical protein
MLRRSTDRGSLVTGPSLSTPRNARFIPWLLPATSGQESFAGPGIESYLSRLAMRKVS